MRQSRGALELRRTEDAPMLSPRFPPFSFYARSLLSLVRRTRVGWKMEGKAHEGKQRLEPASEGGREGGRDVWNILNTARNVRWLSFMPQACGTCLTFLLGLGTLFARHGIKKFGCMHVMIYMYNVAHTLASLVSF